MENVYPPDKWVECRLGDLLSAIRAGKSVRCDERPPREGEKGLVKISAVTWGEFNEKESKTLISDGHLKSEHKIEVGDVLISRANTVELVGACVSVKSISKDLYLSDKVLRLEMDDCLKPLVVRFLGSQNAREPLKNAPTLP